MIPIKLQAARLKIINRYPYFASALMRMQMIESENCVVGGIPTMGVDAEWRCYYHPAFVVQNDIDTIVSILLHELYHLLRAHYARRNERNSTIWNIATDLEINDDLLGAGHRFGKLNVFIPQNLGLPTELLAEQYYEMLIQHLQHQQHQQHTAVSAAGQTSGSSEQEQEQQLQHQQQQQQQQGGTQVPSDVPDLSQQAAPSGQHGTDYQQQQYSQSVPGGAASDPTTSIGGSCSDGIKRDWELEPDHTDVPAVSDVEAEILRREVAQRIQQYISMHGYGTVPAGLARWAEAQFEPPKVDWRRELNAAVRCAIAYKYGTIDYSYRIPNKRYQTEIILPSLVAPLPQIAVVIDTSGSMSDDQLAVCLRELKGILRAIGHGATVLTADTHVHTVQRVWNDPKRVQLVGGGGTDMGRAIDAATKLRPRPDIVIVLTDGDTPWPQRPPRGTKVIVALIGRGSAPDWARVVEVEMRK